MQQQKTAIAFMALVVAMGGFLLAFHASVILGVIKFMAAAFNLSKIKLGRAVAFISLSATAVMIITWTLRGKYELIGLKYLALLNASTVIITETGWPNKGTAFGGSVPSYENAIKYFINANKWAAEDNIELFYFSSFDEAWKIAAEADVGAYWGIWDKNGKLKYG